MAFYIYSQQWYWLYLQDKERLGLALTASRGQVRDMESHLVDMLHTLDEMVHTDSHGNVDAVDVQMVLALREKLNIAQHASAQLSSALQGTR